MLALGRGANASCISVLMRLWSINSLKRHPNVGHLFNKTTQQWVYSGYISIIGYFIRGRPTTAWLSLGVCSGISWTSWWPTQCLSFPVKVRGCSFQLSQPALLLLSCELLPWLQFPEVALMLNSLHGPCIKRGSAADLRLMTPPPWTKSHLHCRTDLK